MIYSLLIALTNALPVLYGLLACALTLSLFSLFISGLIRARASQPEPPHPGYYSAQAKRRVYNQPEAQ